LDSPSKQASKRCVCERVSPVVESGLPIGYRELWGGYRMDNIEMDLDVDRGGFIHTLPNDRFTSIAKEK
jgi:hypothetical protein